jgi:hypothetical protein
LQGYKTAPAEAGLRRKSPIYRALFCSPQIYLQAFFFAAKFDNVANLRYLLCCT